MLEANASPARGPGRVWQRLLAAWGLCALLLAGGCATVAPQNRVASDPWEGFNRRVFSVNEALDVAVLKPVAELYQAVLPHWVRRGIDNMYGNINDVWSSVNLLLQAKPRRALETGMRVGINTLFGLGGFFDVAEEAGLERISHEDFGQTLGVWGLRSGPYMVLPLLGPSSVRDSVGLTADMNASSPGIVLKQPAERNAATALRLLNTRVKLLDAGKVLDDIALDKYVLIRDAYLARRRSQIYDGSPPEDDEPAAAAPAASTPAPAASASGG